MEWLINNFPVIFLFGMIAFGLIAKLVPKAKRQPVCFNCNTHTSCGRCKILGDDTHDYFTCQLHTWSKKKGTRYYVHPSLRNNRPMKASLIALLLLIAMHSLGCDVVCHYEPVYDCTNADRVRIVEYSKSCNEEGSTMRCAQYTKELFCEPISVKCNNGQQHNLVHSSPITKDPFEDISEF